MKFSDWFYSNYDNVSSVPIKGQWGFLHITVLVLVIAFIVASSILLKNKDRKTKRIVLWVMVGILLLFGITRRIAIFTKNGFVDLNYFIHVMLPRPGCAISCWLIIISVIADKKFLYNITVILGMISAVIFFAYPGVGFNHSILLFENIYSIVTHAIILSACVCFIT